MTKTPSPPVPHDQLVEAARGWLNVLMAWHLCPNAACERARACRGNPAKCFKPNFEGLPQGVQAHWFLMGDAKDRGLGFDAALAEVGATEAGAAFETWREAVFAALERKQRRRARGKHR